MPLFNVDELETNPNYVEPSVKRKWTTEFRKWCVHKAIDEGELDKYGLFACGNMYICEQCERKYERDCKDCVETVKQILNDNFVKIDYNNNNFEEVLIKAEKISKEEYSKRIEGKWEVEHEED